jgi:hypothetical protein
MKKKRGRDARARAHEAKERGITGKDIFLRLRRVTIGAPLMRCRGYGFLRRLMKNSNSPARSVEKHCARNRGDRGEASAGPR